MQISIIIPIINAFKMVPIPGFWLKGTQRSNTKILIIIVTAPTERPTLKWIPCAKTDHGEAPAAETSNNPSPTPNKVSPKHKKKNVIILGFKFSGFSELHETLGMFFIDRNIW